MAAPKPRNARARANLDANPRIDLVFEPGEQPDLPTQWIDAEGNLAEIGWSALTLEWWADWCDSPQAKIFSRSDWRSLLSTAFVADAFYRTRKVQFAAELRMREAAFGATPIDRLRLRMAWAEDAERGFRASEAQEQQRAKEARKRYGTIHAVGDAG